MLSSTEPKLEAGFKSSFGKLYYINLIFYRLTMTNPFSSYQNYLKTEIRVPILKMFIITKISSHTILSRPTNQTLSNRNLPPKKVYLNWMFYYRTWSSLRAKYIFVLASETCYLCKQVRGRSKMAAIRLPKCLCRLWGGLKYFRSYFRSKSVYFLSAIG